MKEDETRTLTIPSDLNRIREVSAFAEKGARRAGLPQDAVDDLAIAITEAVNNAIIHGNKSDSSKSVKISLTVCPGSVSAEVRDCGNGFDLRRVRDPRNARNRLKEKGRGIFIIRELVDDVRFERINGGSRVVMTMTRPVKK